MMNKILRLTLLLLSLFLVTGMARAQMFKGEIIGGFVKSQVDGDEAYGFKKYGLTGGVGVVAPVYKNWSLSLETLYAQKGSKQRALYNDSLDGSYFLKLDYVEVPFMIQYTDRRMVSAGAGVSLGRLVNLEEYRHGYRIDSVTMESKIFSPTDWNAFGDLRVRLYKTLILNARYSYSLSKISTRVVTDSMTGKPNKRDFYNNLWTIRLIWMINEKAPERMKRKTDNADE
jgi:hypothetical protein